MTWQRINRLTLDDLLSVKLSLLAESSGSFKERVAWKQQKVEYLIVANVLQNWINTTTVQTCRGLSLADLVVFLLNIPLNPAPLSWNVNKYVSEYAGKKTVTDV